MEMIKQEGRKRNGNQKNDNHNDMQVNGKMEMIFYVKILQEKRYC